MSLSFQDLDFKPVAPASELAIETLCNAIDFKLPDSYLNLLRQTNGGEGSLEMQPWNLCLWPVEEVLADNAMYEVQEDLPEYFAFGSSGGGDMFAFKIKDGFASELYWFTFIFMFEEDAHFLAENFDTFQLAIGKPCTGMDDV